MMKIVCIIRQAIVITAVGAADAAATDVTSLLAFLSMSKCVVMQLQHRRLTADCVAA